MNFKQLGGTEELRLAASNSGGGAGVLSFGSKDSKSEYSTNAERKFFVVGIVLIGIVVVVEEHRSILSFPT